MLLQYVVIYHLFEFIYFYGIRTMSFTTSPTNWTVVNAFFPIVFGSTISYSTALPVSTTTPATFFPTSLKKSIK